MVDENVTATVNEEEELPMKQILFHLANDVQKLLQRAGIARHDEIHPVALLTAPPKDEPVAPLPEPTAPNPNSEVLQGINGLTALLQQLLQAQTANSNTPSVPVQNPTSNSNS